MPVARTYEKFTMDGDPFKENGRMYVNVITPKGLKKVRWYTDAERARMDRIAGVETKDKDIMDFNARYAFGFGNDGYITIYKGNSAVIERWADENHACSRYNLTFGYYTPSHLAPVNIPNSVTPIRLEWEEVMDHDDRMKPHEVVQKIVIQKLGIATQSEYQGEVDTWLQKMVTINEKKTRESVYGTKHTYSMSDVTGNTYIWETGSKDYKCGTSVNLKMKVKEHKEINGNKVTVVWYCKEC